MKTQRYTRYAILFFVLFFSLAAILGAFLSVSLKSYARQEKEEELESRARSIQQSITAMISLTQQDFQYLLDNESHLLYEMLASQRGGGEVELFITDQTGTILISAPYSGSDDVSFDEMTLATEKARADLSFESDLGGIYDKARLIRVVLLEKEFSDSRLQRVGAVFLSVPIQTQSPLLSNVRSGLLMGFFFLVLLTGACIIWIDREILRPLKWLDEAAESFAKGDFSKRLPEHGGTITPLLRAYNEMAEKVEKNETLHQTFISNVSHDLRTPLTTIGGFVQNMMQGTIPPDRMDHYYRIILDEVNRLSRLVQTLLETSRMTAGERKYHFVPTDICELGRITLLSFEKRLEEKGIQVSFEATEDSMTVRADQDAICQVIYNLLDNAIKFTPEDGSLSIDITREEKKVFFAVTNSGDGIPEEEVAHLFDRFYKSDRSRGLDKKGMGLGLFIAKSIVSAHGEEIWVESEEKRYTRFIFSLSLI